MKLFLALFRDKGVRPIPTRLIADAGVLICIGAGVLICIDATLLCRTGVWFSGRDAKTLVVVRRGVRNGVVICESSNGLAGTGAAVAVAMVQSILLGATKEAEAGIANCSRSKVA